MSVLWWGYPMSMVGTARGPSNTVPPAFWRLEHAHLRLWDDPVAHPWRFGPRTQGWAP
jgi:hypothetical protein